MCAHVAPYLMESHERQSDRKRRARIGKMGKMEELRTKEKKAVEKRGVRWVHVMPKEFGSTSCSDIYLVLNLVSGN